MLCLLFWPLFLPFLALKLIVRLLTALIVLPIMLLAGVLALVIGSVAFVSGVLVPLAPFVVVALLIYALTRHSPAASAARG